MTKSELFNILKDVPDEQPVLVAVWTTPPDDAVFPYNLPQEVDAEILTAVQGVDRTVLILGDY